MKKLTVGYRKIGTSAALIVLLGLCACRKKEDGPPATGGTLPGTGNTIVTHYSGAVAAVWPCGSQTCRQTVSINANVIDYPMDRIDVYLCRNADCVNGPIPSIDCASIPFDPVTPCFTGNGRVEIVYGKNVVQFINANEPYWADQAHTIQIPGYSTYYIQTAISR
jgi:hypothetical protein